MAVSSAVIKSLALVPPGVTFLSVTDFSAPVSSVNLIVTSPAVF